MIWDYANQGRQARYPDTIVVRFVARNYYAAPDRSEVNFLDIGSGRHAPHTRFLEAEGFTVTAVDFSTNALAHRHLDICTADVFGPATFDCVLDFNTLCHVEEPPFKKIHSWLKPGGKFFSVAPQGWRDHLANKGYVRCADLREIIELYDDFAPLEIGSYSYMHQDLDIASWIIEGSRAA